MILESGIYTRISPLFEFKKSAAIDDQRVQLSPFSIITVHQSQVGIAYNRGQLSILKPGEHWLNAQENQLFLSMLPTTEQVKALAVGVYWGVFIEFLNIHSLPLNRLLIF